MAVSWPNIQSLDPRSFTCGHCGNPAGPNKGYSAENARLLIYICHFCGYPTFFNTANGYRCPGAAFGEAVEHLPDEIGALYDEARNCMKVSAFTAAVMCCRKLLMNVAVHKGADEDKNFAFYVTYLDDNHHTPADSKPWVDHIRKKANEAVHEIPNVTRDDAEELITFLGMLLKFIYEFPAEMKKKLPKPTPPTM